MVAPLIVGAARVAKTKSSLRKAGGSKSAIVNRRNERIGTEATERMRPARQHLTETERRNENVHRVRNIFNYRNALQTIEKGAGISQITKIKALNRGVLTLGGIAFPAAIQFLFGILFGVSIALEDSWAGWVVPGEALALLTWIMCILIGSYTMIVAGFMMQKYLKQTPTALAFGVCFVLNWIPFFFIIPWTAIWVIFVIKQQK